jgi:acyl-CoA thioester hydrolase
MARIKLVLPDNMAFVCRLTVRITDLNYSGHAGNDRIVALVHEARIQFLNHLGYGELELTGGLGLIMNDLAVTYKTELFYGDTVHVYMKATDLTRVGFDLFYRFGKIQNDKEITAVEAKTGMVCFDFAVRKVATLPNEVRQRLMG